MVKLSSALQQGVLTLFLIITGLYSITEQFSKLEADKASGELTDITNQANALFESANTWQIFGFTIGMCLIPVVLFIIQHILIKKKYIIDEKFYDQMIKEISERKQGEE